MVVTTNLYFRPIIRFEADLGWDVNGVLQSLSTSPWAPDNSFARQQHWGQLVQLLPLIQPEEEEETTTAGKASGGGEGGGGRPLVAKLGDYLEVTSLVSSSGGGGSIFFPSVRVVPGDESPDGRENPL